MVDGNKFKIVDEHYKKLDNQLQNHHLEWQESMVESNERWLEQGTKIEQLVMFMELLSSQFQHLLAFQTARTKTARGHFRGILATPGLDRNVEVNASVEKITAEYKVIMFT